MFNDCFKLDNGVYGQVLVMKKFGSELSDRALADIVDLPLPMAVTWFVQPMDKSKAINFVRTRSAWIDKEIIEEQRSAVNKGYDFSILPQELKYSKEETEDVLDHLQNKNQRLYVFTGLIYTYAESKQQLDAQVMRIISTAAAKLHRGGHLRLPTAPGPQLRAAPRPQPCRNQPHVHHRAGRHPRALRDAGA